MTDTILTFERWYDGEKKIIYKTYSRRFGIRIIHFVINDEIFIDENENIKVRAEVQKK